jgi:drug/metabolite transporter (DMT)-like permease
LRNHEGGSISIAASAIFNNNRLQIVAVILCSTGVALLAYMDAGITNKKKTMTGVLLAALAAAGSAVYKVSLTSRTADFCFSFLNFDQTNRLFDIKILLYQIFYYPN